MAETVFHQAGHSSESVKTSIAIAEVNSSLGSDRVRWLAKRLAVAAWLLMAIGSATRVANAGLACPDWPLCYGQAVPWAQMNWQVFLEWFHRLDAAVVAFGALGLAGTAVRFRRELPGWVVPATVAALALVVLQAGLGALTAPELLRFDVVTAHLGTALAFLALLVAIAAGLTPQQASGTAAGLAGWALLAAIAIDVQSLIGGIVGSRWAVHQCLEGDQLCGVLHTHFWGIVPAVLTIGILLIMAWRTPALNPRLRSLRSLIALLLVAQLAIGYSTYHFQLRVAGLTVLHEAIAAALLASLVAFTVWAGRDRLRESPDGLTA